MSNLAKHLYLGLVYLFLYAPIAVLVVFSFNDSRFGVQWSGFTWRWYAELLDSGQLLEPAANSLLVAALAASAATGLGALAAVALHQYRFRSRRLMQASLVITMMSPDIVMGVSLLTLYAAVGLPLGFVSLLVSHVTFCLPFVAVTVYSRLAGFDPHLVEAASDLGAGEYATFRHVILPLLAPALAAGWLLAFTLSMDDVIVSFFTTGPEFEVLPLRIYSMVKVGVKPVVNALSAILVAATMAVVLLTHVLLKEKS